MATYLGSAQFQIPAASGAAITFTVAWDDGRTGRTVTSYAALPRSGTVDSTATGNLSDGAGMSDGTRHFGTGAFKTDNVTTTDAGSRVINSGVFVESDVAGAATGVLVHTSFGSNNDQVTVTPSDPFLLDHDVEIIAVCDDDGEAYVHVGELPAANGAFTGLTGLPFKPKAAIVIMSFHNSINAGSSVTGYSLGLVDTKGNQAVVTHRYIDNVTTNYTFGGLSTALMMAGPSTTLGGAFGIAVAFTAWTADGFTANQIAGGTNDRQYAMLLIGGKSLWELTVPAARNALGYLAVAVPGIKPRSAIAIADNVSTASQSVSVEATHVSIGYCSRYSQWAQTLVSANRETLGGATVTEEFSRGVTDKFMIHHDRTGANTLGPTGEIARAAFTPEVITLEQVDADPTAYLFPMLVVGDPTAKPVINTFAALQRAGSW